MPVSFQKYTLNAPNSYDVATSNWIDISTAKRVRIVIPKIILPNDPIDYQAWISHGAYDPAQTAVIEYFDEYMCGWGWDEKGNFRFYSQSALFDRNGQELGVNHIKLSYTNKFNTPTLDIFLILES